ncbi:hypothetical protein HHI36_024343 [Cryptolaemus montrouzieri]|uniref:Uncharacterized protein n=1 Tax=Cryptolaemus montrouzieri TaxID=559131 RepID=A0ABD2ND24_9CUCU
MKSGMHTEVPIRDAHLSIDDGDNVLADLGMVQEQEVKEVFKIYRHYTEVHKEEKEVREIVFLPKKSACRKKLLDNLRKKGDYLFNIRNQDKGPILCRETSKTKKSSRIENVYCPNCKGCYSKLSIRHHINKCMPRSVNAKRNSIQAECRKLIPNIHEKASDDLKLKIFPVFNNDPVSNSIKYDEAVIIYGNFLCRKYTAEHHAQQIRSNLRSFGRLIIAIRETNPHIKDLMDVLDPEQVQLIIDGIEKVAGLNKISHLYKAPATAMLLSTELKKMCKLLMTDYAKKGNKKGQKKMEDLLLVFNQEFQVTVNKRGVETLKINSRRKKINLPKTQHIAKFRTTNKKWARISFTGKLGKNTALLVHRDLGFKAIDLILKYREKAGVNPLNRFIFGVPSRFHSQNTFQACQLIRKLAQESGIENSQLLRTRLLRQHLATETATSSVDERLEGRVSDFMSHKRQIHQDYYVMTQKKDDITKVSRLLETFSTSKREHKSESNTDKNSNLSCSETSDEDYSPSVTEAEMNYIFEKKRVYSKRTPHLIMQWVKGQRKDIINKEEGREGKRNRWSTPEKEVLRSSTEKHSAGGTIPTLSECENIFEQNEGVLQGRNPKSIKAYIHRQLRCDNPQFNNNKV